MAIITTAGTPFADAVYADRLLRATAEAATRGIGALLVTPSVDYQYLLGYSAPALERLTCLILPVEGAPALVLPRLEEPLARHELGPLAEGLEIVTWDETDDPFRLVSARLRGILRVGLQDQMWSRFVLRLRDGLALDQALIDRIRQHIRTNTTPRHVPAKVVQVADIPRTKSGKIVELAVRNVVHGRAVKNLEALANPEALEFFRNRPELAE